MYYGQIIFWDIIKGHDCKGEMGLLNTAQDYIYRGVTLKLARGGGGLGVGQFITSQFVIP